MTCARITSGRGSTDRGGVAEWNHPGGFIEVMETDLGPP